MPKITSAARAADIGVQHAERADAVDPHHGSCRVANDAAGAACVRGRDDCGEIADVNFATEHVAAIVPPIRAAAMLSRKPDRRRP